MVEKKKVFLFIISEGNYKHFTYQLSRSKNRSNMISPLFSFIEQVSQLLLP